VNAGNVQIVSGRYVRAYSDELELFPKGKKDDQVDASIRAFANLMELPPMRKPPRRGYSNHMTR
jgi:phage terminase large subunit-like protein